MLYKTYCYVIPNFLTPQEVDYIHGYAQNLEIITQKLVIMILIDGERQEVETMVVQLIIVLDNQPIVG